ncbi:MAG TPA: ribonuclease E activity regulator RraA [Chitinophagales bacterium]|nr:ribonuclease E activity regulator RraA [Chitinophagales bacterium]
MSFQTADLYDANEGKVNVCLPLFQSYGAKSKFYGQIVTLKCHEDNTLVGDTLRNENGQGKVLVIDGGGSLRCALVGDLIAAAAVKNEWAGIIVFGCIRDSVEINNMEIGIKALNTNPTKTVKRKTGLLNEIINFANVTFYPNAYVYSDEDGILVSDIALI